MSNSTKLESNDRMDITLCENDAAIFLGILIWKTIHLNLPQQLNTFKPIITWSQYYGFTHQIPRIHHEFAWQC